MAIGGVLNERYKITRVIGEGGMGVVFEATDQMLSRQVAIKVLSSSLARRKVTAQRFENEAKAIAAINSEHIVEVFDIGRTGKNGIFSRESPFMVMELLKGQDLAGILAKKQRLPEQEAVGYVLEALLALAQAHARGIVHRDLKPANLFLAKYPDGSRKVKVLDFGISKTAGDLGSERRLTTDSQVLGSPAYMAPEQLRQSNKVDPRADIWSLGVILYELMTGRLPFDGSTTGALFAAILEKPPYPMTRFVPDFPMDLERVVLRCLAKRPDTRWASVVELSSALLPFAAASIGQSAVERIARIASSSEEVDEMTEPELSPTDLLNSDPPSSDRSMMMDSDDSDHRAHVDIGTFGEGRSITIGGSDRKGRSIRQLVAMAAVAGSLVIGVAAIGLTKFRSDQASGATNAALAPEAPARPPADLPYLPAASAIAATAEVQAGSAPVATETRTMRVELIGKHDEPLTVPAPPPSAPPATVVIAPRPVRVAPVVPSPQPTVAPLERSRN